MRTVVIAGLVLCLIPIAAASCTDTARDSTPSFSAGTGPTPSQFDFVGDDGSHFRGTASLTASNVPGQEVAKLFITAASIDDPARKWSAQLSISPADLSKGSATILLKPYAHGVNQGFVDDASGPVPIFSNVGTALVTLRPGGQLAIRVNSDARALNGSGGGKYALACSVAILPPADPATNTYELQPDPTLTTDFCAPFLAFQ